MYFRHSFDAGLTSSVQDYVEERDRALWGAAGERTRAAQYCFLRVIAKREKSNKLIKKYCSLK
jgi:hypothetical protein